MAHHDDLLTLARQMVDRNPGSRMEAELRRAASTAYDSLFHLLIHEATDRLVSTASPRTRVARTFEHKHMISVCKEYAGPRELGPGEHAMPSGVTGPSGLVRIASAFVNLQNARHQADYDLGLHMTHTQVEANVGLAEQAFGDWLFVQDHPEADLFLAELWCRGIPKR